MCKMSLARRGKNNMIIVKSTVYYKTALPLIRKATRKML